MAVRTSTAAEAGQSEPSGSIRTCIGCRQRAPAAELLRVVVAPDAIGKLTRPEEMCAEHAPGGPAPLPVVPDPRHRTPGRGAWLHRDPECVELAERRRAFARALRVPVAIDPSPVREYVAGLARQRHDPTADHRRR
ncbi:MAG: YlxR family protein [Actinomycetota bacterium]|nr:YlxR family protein [Actinomycetota bacterium]